MQDEYLEYFLLSGSTPVEIMESFKDIINEKLMVAEPVYSQRWAAMLERGVHQYWIQDIGDSYFAVVQWKVCSYKSREEFLNSEDLK